MNSWRENCNYRICKDENGNPTYIITVEGLDVEVTKEVYYAYAKMERRERYIMSDCAKNRKVSIEQLEEDDMTLEMLGVEPVPSHEHFWLEEEAERERAEQTARLKEIIRMLQPQERELVMALFYEKRTMRDYANQVGCSLSTLAYRKKRVLEKIRKNF